jgi:hypothetical protein
MNLYNLLFYLGNLVLLSCSSSTNNNFKITNEQINIRNYIDLESDDHTLGFQRAFDSALKSGIRRVYIPSGIYFLNKVHIYPGLEIYGDGRGKTILKRIPNASKFSRMFTVQKQVISVRDTLEIHHLEFDGSRLEQGQYLKHKLEHQAMIFLSASNKSSKRIKAKIYECYFHDGCGDAISLYRNTDVQVLNCEAKDVFRGGVTLTGGNSKLLVKNFKAWGEEHVTGVDIEIDGKGFNGSRKVEITMEHIWLEGDFDISAGHGGSFYGNDIYCGKPPLRLSGGPILIENSTFNSNYTKWCYINFPKNIVFKNCIFNVFKSDKPNKGRQGNFKIYWSKTKRKPDNLKLSFENCSFNLKEKDKNKETYVIVNSPQQNGKNNQLIFNNCNILGAYDANLLIRGGGNYSFVNTNSTSIRDFDLLSLNKKPESYSSDKNLEQYSSRIFSKNGSFEDTYISKDIHNKN